MGSILVTEIGEMEADVVQQLVLINVLINQLQVILIVRKYSEVLFVSGVYVTYHKIISQVQGVLGCIVPVLYIIMILFN